MPQLLSFWRKHKHRSSNPGDGNETGNDERRTHILQRDGAIFGVNTNPAFDEALLATASRTQTAFAQASTVASICPVLPPQSPIDPRLGHRAAEDVLRGALPEPLVRIRRHQRLPAFKRESRCKVPVTAMTAARRRSRTRHQIAPPLEMAIKDPPPIMSQKVMAQHQTCDRKHSLDFMQHKTPPVRGAPPPRHQRTHATALGIDTGGEAKYSFEGGPDICETTSDYGLGRPSGASTKETEQLDQDLDHAFPRPPNFRKSISGDDSNAIRCNTDVGDPKAAVDPQSSPADIKETLSLLERKARAKALSKNRHGVADPLLWEAMKRSLAQEYQLNFDDPVEAKTEDQTPDPRPTSFASDQRCALDEFSKGLEAYAKQMKATSEPPVPSSRPQSGSSLHTISVLLPYRDEFVAAGLGVTSQDQRHARSNRDGCKQSMLASTLHAAEVESVYNYSKQNTIFFSQLDGSCPAFRGPRNPTNLNFDSVTAKTSPTTSQNIAIAKSAPMALPEPEMMTRRGSKHKNRRSTGYRRHSTERSHKSGRASQVDRDSFEKLDSAAPAVPTSTMESHRLERHENTRLLAPAAVVGVVVGADRDNDGQTLNEKGVTNMERGARSVLISPPFLRPRKRRAKTSLYRSRMAFKIKSNRHLRLALIRRARLRKYSPSPLHLSPKPPRPQPSAPAIQASTSDEPREVRRSLSPEAISQVHRHSLERGRILELNKPSTQYGSKGALAKNAPTRPQSNLVTTSKRFSLFPNIEKHRSCGISINPDMSGPCPVHAAERELHMSPKISPSRCKQIPPDFTRSPPPDMSKSRPKPKTLSMPSSAIAIHDPMSSRDTGCHSMSSLFPDSCEHDGTSSSERALNAVSNNSLQIEHESETDQSASQETPDDSKAEAGVGHKRPDIPIRVSSTRHRKISNGKDKSAGTRTRGTVNPKGNGNKTEGIANANANRTDEITNANGNGTKTEDIINARGNGTRTKDMTNVKGKGNRTGGVDHDNIAHPRHVHDDSDIQDKDVLQGLRIIVSAVCSQEADEFIRDRTGLRLRRFLADLCALEPVQDERRGSP